MYHFIVDFSIGNIGFVSFYTLDHAYQQGEVRTVSRAFMQGKNYN